MNLHTKSQREYIKMEMMPELKINNISMIKEVIQMAWETQIKTVVLLCDIEDIKKVVNAVSPLLYSFILRVSALYLN